MSGKQQYCVVSERKWRRRVICGSAWQAELLRGERTHPFKTRKVCHPPLRNLRACSDLDELSSRPAGRSIRCAPCQGKLRSATSFYGCAGAGVGAGVVVAGLVASKFTLGACRAPSSVLKYASFRVKPPRLATKLFGNNDMYVL